MWVFVFLFRFIPQEKCSFFQMEKEKMEPLNWWSQYVLSDVSYLIFVWFFIFWFGDGCEGGTCLTSLALKSNPCCHIFLPCLTYTDSWSSEFLSMSLKYWLYVNFLLLKKYSKSTYRKSFQTTSFTSLTLKWCPPPASAS